MPLPTASGAKRRTSQNAKVTPAIETSGPAIQPGAPMLAAAATTPAHA
jgi:hypothetical protein